MAVRSSEGLGVTVCPERMLNQKGAYSSIRCFVEDEGRPLEVGLQEQASNRHELQGRQCPGGERRWKRRGMTTSGEIRGVERE